jgi:hypothetical protein
MAGSRKAEMSTEPIQSIQMRPDSRGKSLTEQVANRIREWLEGPRPSWTLVDWLEGYNLPAVGPEEEPYIWLRRGLDKLPPEYQERFVVQLAQFIEERPDVERPGDRPDEVLYNLLWLCARPGDRARLGLPLKGMYDRAEQREGLTGQSYRGLDLRDTLRLALIANQHDRSLVSVWFRMLRSETDDVLPGTEYSGFYGVLAADLPGRPNLEDLGQALTEMVNYLTPRRGIRLKKLDELFRRIKEYHGSDARWDIDLIKIADRFKWRLWAVDWLPRLWISPDDPANPPGGPYDGKWVVWAPLWRHLCSYALKERLQAEVIEYLARKRVVIVTLDPKVYKRFGATIGPVFEKARRDPLVPGEGRDERGDLAARVASTDCAAMGWGDESRIISEVFAEVRTESIHDLKTARERRQREATAPDDHGRRALKPR